MSVDRGLLALLEAKPGKGDELGAFLKQGRELAAAESGTVTWYAAHLTGQIPAALGKVGPELLAGEPDIRPVDVLAVK
jgi:hypothetical protein